MTTHKGIRHTVHPLHYWYQVYHMQFNMKILNDKFYTDHLLSKNKYLEGNTGAWIYMTGNLRVSYPCKKRSEVGDTLQQFSERFRIPDRLRSDLALDITGKHTEFQA